MNIETERDNCLEAFKGHDYIYGGPAQWAWWVHHSIPCEPLTEPIAWRVEGIMEFKPECERAVRLRWLRPVFGKLPDHVMLDGLHYANSLVNLQRVGRHSSLSEYNQASIEYEKAFTEYKQTLHIHADEIQALMQQEIPGCPFDMHGLIFPEYETEV